MPRNTSPVKFINENWVQALFSVHERLKLLERFKNAASNRLWWFLTMHEASRDNAAEERSERQHVQFNARGRRCAILRCWNFVYEWPVFAIQHKAKPPMQIFRTFNKLLCKGEMSLRMTAALLKNTCAPETFQ